MDGGPQRSHRLSILGEEPNRLKTYAVQVPTIWSFRLFCWLTALPENEASANAETAIMMPSRFIYPSPSLNDVPRLCYQEDKYLILRRQLGGAFNHLRRNRSRNLECPCARP